MLKKMWAALVILTFFFSGLFLPKAKAESLFQPEKFPMPEMQVQVMPEFDYPEGWSRDNPALLIGMYGTITNKSGQDFDGKIEIPVPAKDKDFQVNLVAEFPDPNKPEVQRPFDVDKEKGLVTWKPANPIKNNESYKFVIEYYSKTIDVNDKKSFTYEFANQSAIDQLDVIFYAPMNAKEIQLEPKAQSNEKSEYGEELYYYQYKNVGGNQSLKYSFSYKKDGTESTIEAINKQQPPNDANHAGLTNGTATDQVTSGKSSSNQPIIGIGGAVIIGIAIVIAGVFVFFGLKGKVNVTTRNKQSKVQPKKQIVKKDVKSLHAEEKKELRKKLLTGKIDQETYDEEMKKLI